MKVNIFWGDLSDISAKTATLVTQCGRFNQYIGPVNPKTTCFHSKKEHFFFGKSISEIII